MKTLALFDELPKRPINEPDRNSYRVET